MRRALAPTLLLFLCQTAAAAPSVIVLSQTGECPDGPALLTALRHQLSRFDVDSEPRLGALPVTVQDLGDHYRVVVDGVTREFEDPARNCAERAATAAVFVTLTVEPPLIEPPLIEPPPPPSPAPSPPFVDPFVAPPPAIAPPFRPLPHLYRLELQFLVGTSLGIVPAGAHTDVAYQADTTQMKYVPQPVKSGGAAFEPLHVGIGLALRVTRLVSVGLLARIGEPLLNNADSSQFAGGTSRNRTDFSLLARARLALGEGRAHPFFSAGIGGGWIYHDLDLSAAQSPEYPPVDTVTARTYPTMLPGPGDAIHPVCPSQGRCVDTVKMGYLLFSASAGGYFDVYRGPDGLLRLILEMEVQQSALPVSATNFDFRIGLESALF